MKIHRGVTWLLVIATLAASAAARADLLVSRRACDWLVEHDPAPGVLYQPGLDVHGRTVAPADLSPGHLALPEVIAVPVTVLVQDRYGIPANSVLWHAEAEVGLVEVQGDRVYFNGGALGDADSAALARICRDKAAAR